MRHRGIAARFPIIFPALLRLADGIDVTGAAGLPIPDNGCSLHPAAGLSIEGLRCARKKIPSANQDPG